MCTHVSYRVTLWAARPPGEPWTVKHTHHVAALLLRAGSSLLLLRTYILHKVRKRMGKGICSLEKSVCLGTTKYTQWVQHKAPSHTLHVAPTSHSSNSGIARKPQIWACRRESGELKKVEGTKLRVERDVLVGVHRGSAVRGERGAPSDVAIGVSALPGIQGYAAGRQPFCAAGRATTPGGCSLVAAARAASDPASDTRAPGDGAPLAWRPYTI